MEYIILIKKHGWKGFFYEVNLIVLIIFMNFYSIENNEEIYKLIFVDNYQKIFVFSADYIYSYDSSNLLKIDEYNLQNSDQKVTSSIDAETISFVSTYNNNQEIFDQIYIIVKNYLYNFSKSGYFKNYFKINSPETIIPYMLIFDECIIDGDQTKICFIFYGFILQKNSLNIFRINHNMNLDKIFTEATTNYQIVTSEGVSSESMSDSFTCQIMKISNSRVFTCFYENNNYEIGTIHFGIFNLYEYTQLSPKFKKNSGAIIIKSAIYSENTKAFVCYINNYNDCACLTFDISANKWSDCEYKYLENCRKSNLLFYFDFYKVSNEYILSCFDSNNILISVSFNSNMKLIDTMTDNTYCISNYKFDICENNSLFYSLGYNDGFEMIIICTNNIESLSKKGFTRTCEITSNLNCIDPESYLITTTYSEKKMASTYIDYESTIITIHSTINNEDVSERDESDIIIQTNKLSESEEISNVSKNNIIKKTTNQKKEDFVNNLDNLMKDIEIGKVYELQGDDYEAKISPINFNDFEESSTYIDFLECEKKE